MTINQELKELIKKVKFAPSREWVNAYFDLMKQVLDITGLKDGDPRLVMPLSKTRYHFPMSINSRYVFSSFEEESKLKVGLIFTPDFVDITKLRNKEGWAFSNGKSKIEPPYFLKFNNLQEVVSLLESSKQVKLCWHEALITETNRAKGGRHGSGHKSIIYKLVTDKKFRAEILDMAFSELSDEEQENTGAGYGDSETNRKVEQAAISFVTNDYKKRGWLVKSVESEKQGFDLLCTKAKIQEHVEVKGVQGNLVSFIITSGEVKKSQSDKHFVLYVVKSALSNPKLQKFTAKEFKERFTLEAKTYHATLKKK